MSRLSCVVLRCPVFPPPAALPLSTCCVSPLGAQMRGSAVCRIDPCLWLVCRLLGQTSRRVGYIPIEMSTMIRLFMKPVIGAIAMLRVCLCVCAVVWRLPSRTVRHFPVLFWLVTVCANKQKKCCKPTCPHRCLPACLPARLTIAASFSHHPPDCAPIPPVHPPAPPMRTPAFRNTSPKQALSLSRLGKRGPVCSHHRGSPWVHRHGMRHAALAVCPSAAVCARQQLRRGRERLC